MSDLASIHGPDAALDGLVRLAAQLCDAPLALVTPVGEGLQVFAAPIGFDGHGTAPHDIGFWPLVVARGETIVIPGAWCPAYAGYHLHDPRGGSLRPLSRSSWSRRDFGDDRVRAE